MTYISNKVLAIPVKELPRDVHQSNEYIRQNCIFANICQHTLYRSKNSWNFGKISVKKGEVVLLADTELMFWTEGKLYVRFLFIHEDIVHQMKVPVMNWNVWFEPISPEDEESS